MADGRRCVFDALHRCQRLPPDALISSTLSRWSGTVPAISPWAGPYHAPYTRRLASRNALPVTSTSQANSAARKGAIAPSSTPCRSAGRGSFRQVVGSPYRQAMASTAAGTTAWPSSIGASTWCVTRVRQRAVAEKGSRRVYQFRHTRAQPLPGINSIGAHFASPAGAGPAPVPTGRDAITRRSRMRGRAGRGRRIAAGSMVLDPASPVLNRRAKQRKTADEVLASIKRYCLRTLETAAATAR